MVHLLEAKGIDVYWLSEDSPCVSAFSFCREKKPYVFINGGNGSGERGRHSAAHELGHLVLHRNVDKLKHDKEAEADEFASAFLMPLEQFTAESPPTPILDSLLRLKKRWGTSVASMVVRNHKIGKYGQWYYENAFKEISRRGWRLQEPEEIPMEHSAIHELAYNSMNERGETPAHFAAQLNLHLEDLTELTPIARNYIGRRKHLRLVLSESK
jgi:Zn-dependent peptidase ImmA (M78 family)